MMLLVPLTGTSSLVRSSDEQSGRRKRMRTKVMTEIAVEEASSSGISDDSLDGVRAEIL
jgi:hypothetical protein